jgi:hypothetical protein
MSIRQENKEKPMAAANRKQEISRRRFLKAMAASGVAYLVAGRGLSQRSAALPAATSTATAKPGDAGEILITDRWASSENLQITINALHAPPQILTSGHGDFKPSWSPDGSRLTFFRAYLYGADFKDWRTTICVINADGTGFRELTSGQYPDFNPTWTRDGSNQIVFNRYSTQGGWRNQVYWTAPTGKSGDEQMLSAPDYPDWEWVTGALRDGRLFVDRFSDSSAQSFLLTPKPGGTGQYEEVERPTTLLWHKLTIAPSETRVAYMLDYDRNPSTYHDVAICYADFDARAKRITNQVIIAEPKSAYIREYPCWNKDESLVLYDANPSGKYQLYAYRLADGLTQRVSPLAGHDYQFADFEGVPK